MLYFIYRFTWFWYSPLPPAPAPSCPLPPRLPAQSAAEAHVRALADADRALGRGGIPSLVMEEGLAQLQVGAGAGGIHSHLFKKGRL